MKTWLISALLGVSCFASGCRQNLATDTDKAKTIAAARPVAVPQPAAAEPIKLTRYPHMKTLGGRQFWGDVAYFHGWRIQQNVFSEHYRLLDPEDYRFASGTLDECRETLERIKQQENMPPMSGKVAIVIHGIIRSSKSFGPMVSELQAAGYHVVPFDYPSTRVEIPQSAAYLKQVIDSLEGVEEINFVVHSMGGLVVRSYLTMDRDPRIKRMVMLGVPNLGATMADHVHNNLLFRMVSGPAGLQLGRNAKFVDTLPTPDFEFAIVAGTLGTKRGYNPFTPGDDDGTVCVAETRLPGAIDFIAVRGLHSFLMNHKEVIKCTRNFLETGRLRKDQPSQPIPVNATVE